MICQLKTDVLLKKVLKLIYFAQKFAQTSLKLGKFREFWKKNSMVLNKLKEFSEKLKVLPTRLGF